MVALDTLVVSTALSTIRVDLGASIEQLEWTVNAYNLSFAVLLMTGAGARRPLRAPPRLRDRAWRVHRCFGRLRARAEHRCADRGARRPGRGRGAGDARSALTLVSAAFPPERRGAALGIFFAMTGLAVASGPLVGGAVIEGIAWEWIFWLNVPIGDRGPARRSRGCARATARHRARPPRPGSCDRCRVRLRLGPRARKSGGLGEPRGRRVARRRGALLAAFVGGAARAASRCCRCASSARGLLGGQRGDLLRVRVAVHRRVLLRAAPPDRPRLRPARCRAAAASVDRHVHFVAPVAGALVDRFGERPFMVVGLRSRRSAWPGSR